jgi:hypothetical protein
VLYINNREEEQMKKSYKVLLIILSLWAAFTITDYTLSCFDKRPIFSFPIKFHKDGGTIEYYGLGYKVIKYNVLGDKKTGQPGRKDADFGFWNLKYKNGNS